ncbi:uncharacterized protein METZ01_LOCUS225281 [marine metagenome]|uniref:Uncharacterized protein n=1 Tax=marine metagenome TaxID=408172 RepID=A0A382GCW1_9ZZZZ
MLITLLVHFCGKRKQSKVTRTFYGFCDLALTTGAGAGDTAGYYFTPFRNEPA